MKGVLTLGKFLIWLSVFLFLYSSFLVLLQYGSANYSSHMISGWGSIAGEMDKSYRTLTSLPPPSISISSTEPAKAGEGAATPGTAKKPGELPGHVAMLIWGSVVISLLGFFWMIAVAFQESMLWGLGVLFIPGLFIVYWLTHFREGTPAFIILLIGGFIQFFVFSHYGIDFQDYFLGTPPQLTPNQPDPLAGMILPMLTFILG